MVRQYSWKEVFNQRGNFVHFHGELSFKKKIEFLQTIYSNKNINRG